MRIAGEIVNYGSAAADLTLSRFDQVGYMATPTQKWVTAIVLYLRRAHLGK